MSNPPHRRYVVGYALAAKKVESFIQPSLVEHARLRGIDLVQLDPRKTLLDQGELDCVIHKLYDEVWTQRLKEFQEKRPDVPVIDPLESIEQLHNRVSMLQVVTQLKFSLGNESVDVPKQVVVLDSEDLMKSRAAGDLNFPVIAKPLEADGSPISHNMFLVFDEEGLNTLTTPIVLQEFVNHGGVIFKVYVVGEHVTCVKRKSLPDISPEKIETLKGSLPFSQVSNLTAKSYNDKSSDMINVERAEMPPLSFVKDVAKSMREAMRLNLFNFDVIRDAADGNRYLVIDINYFPGYAKMPEYESILTDFFWSVVHERKGRQEVGSGVSHDDNGVEGKN